MRIRVQSIHFDADKKLLAFIQKKAYKLSSLSDNIIKGEVYLRLEKSEDEANKIAEIRLTVPGRLLFVKEQCKTFEEATDLAVEALRRQVNKYKAKLQFRLSDHKQLVTVGLERAI
jgi:putative sigma-54 modulation protein